MTGGTPVTVDPDVTSYALNGLRPYPVAITTVTQARTNGLIALSAGAGSVVPEAPRVVIGLTKYNLTHDLVVESGVFVMHLLGASPDRLEASLQIIQALGGRSGREGDKLAGLATKTGVTGAPVLTDALVYVEGRVMASMDCEESTYFMADVVAAERLSTGDRLDIGTAWRSLPKDWVETYERNHEAQVDHARTSRGLPTHAGAH
jgi:flavin reductase (DIM6/NTAB) family NADH-FMN oxidoreductase RutF